jgi:RHS repeat-associated protein
MSYAGVTFVDESGATFDLTGIAYGAPIPGTHWVVLDADSVKTKGGLVHDFSATGKLAAIHWLGFDYPRLRFTTGTIGGTERVAAIDQCTAATTCSNLFTLSYTASAELQTVTDSASRTASFTWDSGRLATAKDGLDNAKDWAGLRYEYVGTNLTAITNSENERTWYTYDSAARLKTAAKFGDGNPTWSFDYFAQTEGLYWTRVTNPVGEITHFRFDGLRRLGSLELASVSETTAFLWSDRRVSRITRPDGVEANFQITNDDVTQVSEATLNVTTITYAPNAIDPGSPRGRPVDVISDSLGPVLDRGYDPQGRLTSAANGAGDTTTYSWVTGPTALASVTTPAGVLTTFSGHGAHGHPGSASTGPFNQSYTYDAMGNLQNGPDTDTELSPGMGGIESRTFDADRNVATVSLEAQQPWPPHSETLTLETRSDGLLKAIRRPYGGDTEFDYSATGRVLARREKADGAWVATSFGYDALDRITSTELANGMRSELGYDGAGRIRTITSKRLAVVEESQTRTFSNGRLVSSLDSAYSGPETYGYDAAGRVSTIVYPGGERRELAYDLRSRVTSERFIDAAEATVLELTYAYDLANRVVEIRRQPLNVLQLKYTYTNGFVTQTDYGNGLRRTVTMNPSFGLPYTSVTRNAQSQIVEDSLHDYGNGLIVGKESTIAGSYGSEVFSTWSEWRADQALQSWYNSDYSESQSGSEYFHWDSLSNYRIGGYQSLTYNAEANRLTAVNSASRPHTYSYDAAGFTTDRDGVALTYDATGAIASIGTLAAFDHDLDGRPVSRTLNGVTKSFRFGGAIAYGTAGTPIEADLGEVVIKLDGTGNRYRHLDFRGNVLFQTNNAGSVTGQVVYRAFGRFYVSGNVGERGFAGGLELPSLGLVVLGPRVLDSDAARFLSPDPVFNAVNQYAYAQGNPVFFWDPTGTLTATQVGFGIAAIAGGALAVAAISAAPVTVTGAIVAAAMPSTAAYVAAAIGGGVLGMATANLVVEAVNPEGERLSGANVANWVWDNLPLTGLFPDTTGGSGGGGSGSGGAGLGGGGGTIHGPNSFKIRRTIIITPEGALGGDRFGGIGGLTFSISVSFSGAMW